MTGVRIYPKADAKTQWWENNFSRATFTKVEKLCLHSTETTGWPSYDAGAKAPTLTYFCKTRQWRQHNFINTSARALVDPTTTPVRENRDNVVQIEIIGYADEIIGKQVGGVLISQMTDDNLKDIADFWRWLNAEWGCPIQNTLEFPAYRPYKNVRLTSAQYDAYRGLCGHAHVPGNSHTDPGNINASKIVAFAKVVPPTTPAPKPPEFDVISQEDIDKIADAVVFHKTWPPKPGQPDGVQQSSFINNQGWQTTYLQTIMNTLASVAEKVGAPVDVDEAAIASAVVSSLTSTIHDAVVEALAGVANVDEEAIATSVVDKIGSALAGPPKV